MKKTCLLYVLLLMGVSPLLANFINVQNTTLSGQNSTNGTIQVQFDLSWQNSWRDSINYDGAWLFIKYRIGTGVWLHAHLNDQGFVTGTGTSHAIKVAPMTSTNVRTGAMIYRNTGGFGNFNATGIELQWLYGSQSVTDAEATSAQLRVFAIEMVYIPQGNFFVGDGITTRGHFNNPSGQPIQITGTGYSDVFRFNTTSMTHRVHGQDGLDINGNLVMSAWPTDNPDYPTGWKSFWMMKYEISQGQYVDFLNTLTYDQQSARVGSTTNVVNNNAQSGTTTDPNRHTIRIGTAGVSNTVPRVYITVRPDRACGFLSWPDGAAYSDWSGLRPLSELEFEKAGRGYLNPVSGEYAWGTTTLVNGNSISGTENGTETITTPNANYSDPATTKTGGDGSNGPLRVGIHATATSTRITAGASYFGVMDMTGNMIERYVNVQHNQGRTYRGYSDLYHGDGALSPTSPFGMANVPYWTGNSATTSNVAASGNVTLGTGLANRGGNANGDVWQLSDRPSTGTTVATTATGYVDGNIRDYRFGFRAGRSDY
jgi:formylglycine-generating enzyme required for sulfatase activity